MISEIATEVKEILRVLVHIFFLPPVFPSMVVRPRRIG
jgi:hypothetical protein